MKPSLLALLFCLMLPGAVFSDTTQSPEPAWINQVSGVTARLRGVSAVSDSVAWASGSANTVLRTDDGGAHWIKLALPPDMMTPTLDFRDIHALDTRSAYLLSIGESTASRIFKTNDAGLHWQLQYMNKDPKGFLDAMGFWDKENGLVIGDSIDGHIQILITSDGGANWTKVPDAALPPALPNEGAFSASGSNIAVIARDDAWIAMNARVLHTADRGKTWTVSDAPLPGSASAGIFSIAFRDTLHGVIVGGDYKAEDAAVNNIATTSDGGRTWTLVQGRGLSGFRSAVKYLPNGTATLIAVGPTGADISRDDGATWSPLAYPTGTGGFDAISFGAGLAAGWASGNKGAVAHLKFD
jgi:photosystem II stability/assembly factor-like uncharacterized protein